MSRQIISILSTFFVLISLLQAPQALAYGDSGGAPGSGMGSGIVETQQRRASERFNIIDWIRNTQAQVNAQNTRYGRGSSAGGPFSDFVLLYEQDNGAVTRNAANLGKDVRSTGRLQFLLDDFMTQGSKTKSLNIDIGVEGFLSQTTSFTVDPTSTQALHAYNETGGGLLLRPFGRSSQDTGLIVKGGYMNLNETGLWTTSQTQASMYAPYLGAEVKLYLLSFLGVRADYLNALESQVDALQSKWKMQRFTYGAFLEVYLLNFGVYLMSTEMILTPSNASGPVKELYNGVGFSGSLYF